MRCTASPAKLTCLEGSTVGSVAVNGARLAWLAWSAGNSEAYEGVFEASLTDPRERQLASSHRSGQVDSGNLTGSTLSGPAPAGAGFAYVSWRSSFENPGQCGGGNDDPANPCRVDYTDARLHLTGGATIPLDLAGARYASADAGDSGRLAVGVADGRILIYAASGTLLRTIHPLRAAGSVLALRRDRVAFLSKRHTLDVFDTGTGRLVHSFPLAPGESAYQGFDLYYGYALYGAGKVLHVVKLATGNDRVLATATDTLGPFQVDAPGAVYVTRSATNSTLHFLPLARLKALVG